MNRTITRALVLVAVGLGGWVVAGADGDTSDISAQAGLPSNGTVNGISFFIEAQTDFPGLVCVRARISPSNQDSICGRASDIAHDGVIFGTQVDSGPVRVYGVLPEGSRLRSIGRDPKTAVVGNAAAVVGQFFDASLPNESEVAVEFARSDGTVVRQNLGRP